MPPLLKLKPGDWLAATTVCVVVPLMVVVDGRRLQVAQDAAVEEHRVLQAQFDAELVGVAQVDRAISTWIMTMGGRASSCSMIPFTSSKNRGVALSTRLLLTGSGTTTTSRSICSKALVSPGPACWTCRSVVRNVLIVVATSVAGEFFSRNTTLLRCRTSPSSSRVRIASTTFRSPIVPEAMMLLVRVSTPNRSGTSEFSLPLAGRLHRCGRIAAAALLAAGVDWPVKSS